MDIKRYEGETDEELIVRVCQLKDDLGLSWDNVADLLNSLIHNDTPKRPSTYRNKFKAYTYMKEHIGTKSDAEELAEIKEQRLLLEKEKIKFRDERNEYRRLVREQARLENLLDLIKDNVIAYEHCGNLDNTTEATEETSITESGMVVHLTDIHYGIQIDNGFNIYNEQICKERLNRYLERIREVQHRHQTNDCLLILGGDLVSGIIHFTLRLENNKNIVKQVIGVSKLLSDFIYQLSKMFTSVKVINVAGNHGRINSQKELNAKGENFDALIPFYLKIKLENITSVEFIDNSFDESIGYTEYHNQHIVAVHGDKDSPTTIVKQLTLMLGFQPDICYIGHRHTNSLTTEANTKVIQSGCVVGNDNYCIDNRMFNYPEQTITIINENDGLECMYNVRLD